MGTTYIILVNWLDGNQSWTTYVNEGTHGEYIITTMLMGQ